MTRSELAKAIQARFAAKGHPLTRAEALDLLDETIEIVKDGVAPRPKASSRRPK